MNDELCSDERLTNAESRFRVNVFNGTFDIMIAQLSQRFTSLRQTVNCFKVIEPEILSSSSDNFLFEEATKLAEMYKEDLTTKFPEQILAFRGCLKTQILNVKSIRQLADLLIVKNQCISSNFAKVCSAFLIFLTLPVTVASAERSFSKLKLIKSYLRSTISQERLSGLAPTT